MGDPANQRDDDDVAGEEPRVSGVHPLALVVSPEQAAEHERLEPADRPKYNTVVVYPPETIDVWRVVQEIKTIPIVANVVRSDEDDEILSFTPSRRERRMQGREADQKLALADWCKQRSDSLRRQMYRDRLLLTFFLRELLPLAVLEYSLRFAGTLLRTAILPRSPFSAIKRLLDFTVDPEGRVVGHEAKKEAMRLVQQQFIRLQVRAGFQRKDESVEFFHNLEKEDVPDVITLSSEAESVFLALRRTVQRTSSDDLYRTVLRRRQTEAVRIRLIFGLIKRAQADAAVMQALGRWLHYAGDEGDFLALCEVLGDKSSLFERDGLSEGAFLKLASDLKLDFLIIHDKQVRKFMQTVRQGYAHHGR